VVDASVLAGLVVAALILIIVPGPSVTFIIGRAVAFGRRAAVLTVVGNELGMFVLVLLVAAGVGSIVQNSVFVLDAMRLAGGAYIVYLGVQAVRHRRGLATVLLIPPTRPSRHIVGEGFVVGVTNPKLIVFFTAVLPHFVDPDGFWVPLQLAVLGLIVVTVAFVCHNAWGLLAGTAREWLSNDAHGLARLRRAGGLLMIGLGTQLIITGQIA
jgi:threonine/homoserine/homoserine lactone efflux protein